MISNPWFPTDQRAGRPEPQSDSRASAQMDAGRGRGEKTAMKASVGDRLIVEGTYNHEPRRIGVITELRHDDGSPPYVVHWIDSEHETLVFPGPDARVVSKQEREASLPPP
ncbi:DUF1918 domain-containing protein [Nonomuraea sp. NPDC050022]|uniref:DUF1918 domain-containing protein n=1 Tax=unclassified Nonomuraea TaxID=2593643 RepID=UPI0033F4C1DF